MQTEFHGRPSRQPRFAAPVIAEDPHPTAVKMADVILDIQAIGQGVSWKDIRQAGFTAAEIAEFFRSAERIARSREPSQIGPSPDRVEDVKLKAREPIPNAPPLPAGTRETQALVQGWGAYCAARQALVLDRWAGQRERCIDLLRAYLDRLPLTPRERKIVWQDVSSMLQRVQ